MKIYLDKFCYNRSYDVHSNAEKFISTIKRDSFDYTKWHSEYFGDIPLEEINKNAVEYAKYNPHKGNGKRI